MGLKHDPNGCFQKVLLTAEGSKDHWRKEIFSGERAGGWDCNGCGEGEGGKIDQPQLYFGGRDKICWVPGVKRRHNPCFVVLTT